MPAMIQFANGARHLPGACINVQRNKSFRVKDNVMPALFKVGSAWPALVLAGLGALLLLGLAALVWNAPLNDWNDMRLATTFALARGIDPYGTTESLLSSFKPPLAFASYLPAALFSNADSAVRAASLWSVLLTLATGIAILWRLLPGRVPGMAVLFAALACCGPGLSMVGVVHADAPMVAFAGLAAYWLQRGLRDWPAADGRRALAVAAGWLVTAVMTKLNALPLLLAAPLLVWHGAGTAALRWFCLWLLAGMLLAAGLVWLLFDGPMYLYKVFLNGAAHYPAQPSLQVPVLTLLPTLLLLLVTALWGARGVAIRVFLGFGVALLLAGVIGVLKPGGAANHLAIPQWFLALAACLALAQTPLAALGARWRPRLATVLVAAVLLTGSWMQLRLLWSLRSYAVAHAPLKELDRLLAADATRLLVPTRPLRLWLHGGWLGDSLGGMQDFLAGGRSAHAPLRSTAAVLLVPNYAMDANRTCAHAAAFYRLRFDCATASTGPTIQLARFERQAD